MKPTCYRHPGVEAFTTCPRCTETSCNVCETIHGTRYYCPPCAKALRARSNVIKAAAAVVLLAGVGAGVYAISQYEPPFDYGDKSREIGQLKDLLAKEPCDRSKIIQLGEALNGAGDCRGAIETSNAFLKQCGEYERLLRVPYRAHKRLSEWPQAAAVATHLIEADPYDKDYRWWRGIVYEQAGDFEKAASDYVQAIALVPQPSSIPLNLANMYEKLGRPSTGSRGGSSSIPALPTSRSRRSSRSPSASTVTGRSCSRQPTGCRPDDSARWAPWCSTG